MEEVACPSEYLIFRLEVVDWLWYVGTKGQF
jgi:hypothetical protein